MSLPPLNVPDLLRRYGLRPDKRLGQNFLIDPQALLRVIEIAQITKEDDLLEIGPGLGSLTRLLALRARQVVAVELDGRLIPILHEVLTGFMNIRLVQGDILALDLAALMNTGEALPLPATTHRTYQVVANIPYYITSAVIRRLLESSRQPDRMTLTVQQEVAERICATPGEMSLLALSVQVYGAPQVAARIPADAFYPPPQVDSAVVKVEIYPQPIISAALLPMFFRLAKAGFSQKRKNLRNSLSGGMGWSQDEAGALLNAAGIDPRRRAETLSLEEWQRLASTT
jgi:16S rRNA (adenine1518-N6/adenine1519-N6)-dimethyltransferase